MLTSTRFRPDPDAQRLLVQTGDLGKLDHHGHLIHKGRKDTQVKVRGYRVELSEIEAHLGRHWTVYKRPLSRLSTGQR